MKPGKNYSVHLKIFQDYLREQPDNMKSFNIVAETAGFLNLVYSNINPQNILLVIQLFESLNEFTVVSKVIHRIVIVYYMLHICDQCFQGNQPNRSVMLNSKIVDYVNFILRAGEFKGCTKEQILQA